MENLKQEVENLKKVVDELKKVVGLSDISDRKAGLSNKEIGIKELMPVVMALRESTNGGLINCLTEYPTVGLLSDLKRHIYARTFEFTQLLSIDGSFTDFITKLYHEQDKIFIDILNSCAESTKQETSTVYNFDEKSFNTVRYLVERNRKSVDYVLFNRTLLSDMVRDFYFLKNVQIDGNHELVAEGLVGNIGSTQLKTTASTVTEEPISSENIYALGSNGNGYHTRLEVSFDNKTGLVKVVGEVTLAIDPKSVAKLTIFKNI